MLCEKFPPYNVSGTARPYYFAKHLPEFGYAPTVVSSELPKGEKADWSLLEQLPGEVECRRARPLFRFAYQASVERRVKVAAAKGAEPGGGAMGNVWRRAQQLGPRGWVEEARWAMTHFVDWNLPVSLLAAQHVGVAQLIWATAPHARNLVPAYLLSKLWNKPLIVDLRDPWTYGSLWNPVTFRAERWERDLAATILNHAERIVVTSPLTMVEMQKRFPGRVAERMVTITNGYAEVDVKAERSPGDDKFLLRYIGMLNERRTPDVLLDALCIALEHGELARDLRVEFIGSMGNHESKLADPRLHGTARALGQVSHERSLALIKGSDVNVILQTIEEGQDVIAGKTFEYLAAGQPILAIIDEQGGDAWLLRQGKAGMIVGWRDPKPIAAAIVRMWELWKAARLRSEFPPVDVHQYTRQSLTRRLAEVFDQVLA
jgi:glycosyltransferase involved in cell wall biosynthesis